MIKLTDDYGKTFVEDIKIIKDYKKEIDKAEKKFLVYKIIIKIDGGYDVPLRFNGKNGNMSKVIQQLEKVKKINKKNKW